MDEKAELLAFQRRERAAFDAVFDAHAGPLLAFALRLTGCCRTEAEDLVQETFVAAYHGAGRFGGRARLATYLTAILLRRWRDRRRVKRHPQSPLFDEHELPTPKATATESLALSRIAYEHALTTLSEPQREAFLLVIAQGFTHAEAAQLLKTPVSTVKSRVAEATRRLRAALTEEPLP